MKRLLIISSMLLVFMINGYAQYFGQNKPAYKELNYQLFKTPHFELYHYFKNPELVKDLGELAEKWYYYHQQVLIDTFYTRNPIILYSNHADFQQTTAIGSRIDVGTGGVTEGMKNRVVLPVTYSQHQTDHVMGHELVHAFQYHMLEVDPEISLMSIGNIPLWMVEGMAEYLSIGSVNSQTNLWMRDALINNHFPSLKEMTYDYRYSPYRFGHSFWAFISYKFGEQYVPRLFKATAREGYEKAIGDVLMLSTDSLSVLWKKTIKDHLINASIDSTFTIIGERILSKKNSGRYNLNPAVSPDGKHIVFLSERDLYAIDLFLANANTGDVESRLYTATSHDEIDALNYLETSGSWSPDSRYFAFIAFAKGKATCMVFDTKKKQIINEISFEEVDDINWPAWSPDGDEIAFAGLKEAQSDIYIFHLKSKELRNLTNNKFACMQPSWSKNGQHIYYSTDEPSEKHIPNSRGFFNIAYTDKEGKHKVFNTFEGAKNLNPVELGSPDEVFFLSDFDGRRNLYLLNTTNNQIFRITEYPTGIIGMTEYSPALAVSGQCLYYTMLWDGEFSIYKTNTKFINRNKKEVQEKQMNLASSRLVPFSPIPSQVETNLYFNRQPYTLSVDSFFNDQIKRKFKLDYLGNIQGGVMAGRFGAGMAGSMEALFSDILGQNMLYTAISINGEVYDFGGQVAYINQQKRIKVGTSLSHIPYRYGSFTYDIIENEDGSTSKSLSYLFRRTFEDKVSVFTFIPINKTRRFELGASYALYNYRIEKFKNLSSYNQFYASEKEKMPAPSGFGTAILDFAFVIDNAKMGLASPVEGKRLRIQAEHYLHHMKMQTLLVDYRKYFFIKPYSLAFRIYHYGRYGNDSDSDRMTELFLGSPWYVRGYDTGEFYGNETEDGNTISLNQLIGTRLLVSNVEWRVPFTGPRELAMISSGILFSELALFIDAGVSWNQESHPVLSLTTHSVSERIPVFSSGLAYRINLFGAMVIEPYYAFPYHQGEFKPGQFGLNILAGW
ncbi:eIF2A-related protein [Carboxylicivirga caseinilyticus]|uniref:TolB family protein n=1 Tax=Carboxylicivirga caseinilyticus TaxID=3417572 RepID=UPI003D3504DA|nr:PD40 domain-containing protein [Marinilabiliaceae bacterium A049]